jgi:integrase
MPPIVIDELAAHLARRGAPASPEDLVFTSPKGLPLRRKHFRNRVWLPAVAEAGFDDLTFHGLRHSAAGLMIQLRTHPRVMQKRLGHSSIRTTMDIYGSVLDEVDAEVVDGLKKLVSSESRGHFADIEEK